MDGEYTFTVTVHPYYGRLGRTCAYELGNSSSQSLNALVFIGGLGDGPHTVPYIKAIADKLRSTDLGYSVFEIRMESSFSGFGHTSLKKDAEDILDLVKYLHGIGKQKIVLLGHSTGCQDCVEYAKFFVGQNEPVDGFILQGPVSDRESFSMDMSQEGLSKALATAHNMIQAGNADDAMPRCALPPTIHVPITAYRFNSLAGPGGDDDFFSSDLSDEQVSAVWLRFRKPILILPSAEDEHVPKSIDVAGLISRWETFCAPGIFSDLSASIPGANHTVDRLESQAWMADRVVGFLAGLRE